MKSITLGMESEAQSANCVQERYSTMSGIEHEAHSKYSESFSPSNSPSFEYNHLNFLLFLIKVFALLKPCLSKVKIHNMGNQLRESS